MSSLPSKLFFRIGEVAGLVGVEPHVLRYWEREFRSIRPTKSAKGQRVYSRKDVENLLRVRDLLYRDGFTIAGAKKRLQRGGVEPDAAPASELLRGHAGDADHNGEHDDVDEEHEGEASSAEPESGARAHPAAELPAPYAAAAPAAFLASPASPSSSSPVSPLSGSRAKLSALRAEVEAFLEELEPAAATERSERV